VKDWHLLAELESKGVGAGSVYEVPECFRGTFIPSFFTGSGSESPSSWGSELNTHILID